MVDLSIEEFVKLLPKNQSLAIDFRHLVKEHLKGYPEGSKEHDSLLVILENLDHYLALV